MHLQSQNTEVSFFKMNMVCDLQYSEVQKTSLLTIKSQF